MDGNERTYDKWKCGRRNVGLQRQIRTIFWSRLLMLDSGYLYSDPVSTYYIFATYDSISTWYNIDDTEAAR